MKQTLIIIVLMMAIQGFSQGVFTTAEDFQNQEISAPEIAEAAVKVKANNLFDPSRVVVKTPEGKEVWNKYELYGYQDHKNRNYRFYFGKNFQIIDTAAFYIYKRQEYVVNGKAKERKTHYYFSAEPDAPIERLNKKNLKNAFPYHRNFHQRLDQLFRTDRELVHYGLFHPDYRLHLLHHDHP